MNRVVLRNATYYVYHVGFPAWSPTHEETQMTPVRSTADADLVAKS